MKIGLIQYSPEWENKKENKIKISRLLENQNGVSLFILPDSL